MRQLTLVCSAAYSSPVDTWHGQTTPHWDNLHCGMPGGAQANIEEICGRGAMKTLVLTGTHSFTFLPGSVVSHPHLFNCTCYYEGKHSIVWRWDLHCVSDFMGHWQEPVVWCWHNRKGELKCLVGAEQRSPTDLPHWLHYSRPFFLQVNTESYFKIFLFLNTSVIQNEARDLHVMPCFNVSQHN